MKNTDLDILKKFDNLCNATKKIADYFSNIEKSEPALGAIKRSKYLADYICSFRHMLIELLANPNEVRSEELIANIGDITKGMDNLPHVPSELFDDAYNCLDEFIALLVTKFHSK